MPVSGNTTEKPITDEPSCAMGKRGGTSMGNDIIIRAGHLLLRLTLSAAAPGTLPNPGAGRTDAMGVGLIVTVGIACLSAILISLLGWWNGRRGDRS